MFVLMCQSFADKKVNSEFCTHVDNNRAEVNGVHGKLLRKHGSAIHTLELGKRWSHVLINMTCNIVRQLHVLEKQSFLVLCKHFNIGIGKCLTPELPNQSETCFIHMSKSVGKFISYTYLCVVLFSGFDQIWRFCDSIGSLLLVLLLLILCKSNYLYFCRSFYL